MAHDIAIDLEARVRGKSLRIVARELGLPESSIGIMSKMLRGLPVSDESRRRIGRALQVEPPPRTPPRLYVPKHLAHLVEAARAAGRSTEDILLKGVGGDSGR